MRAVIAFRGVTAKAFRHVAGALVAFALLRAATADSLDSRPAVVDMAAARVLLSRELKQVPWLLRETPRPLATIDLASLAPPSSLATALEPQEANSEKRQPLHLGSSPREQLFLTRVVTVPRLPLPLKALAEHQALQLAQKLGGGELEIEAWPTQNDVGRLTWVMSRHRRGKDAPWQWLDMALLRGVKSDANTDAEPQVILPEHVSLSSARGEGTIFRDFFAADAHDLYEKPLFSHCIFTTADKRAALAAWRPSVERMAQQAHFKKASAAEKRQVFCIALPQPARLQHRPLTLHLRVRENKVDFVEKLDWITPPLPERDPLPQVLAQSVQAARVPEFPPSFDADFRRDVEMLTGTLPLDGTGAGIRLLRKNSADPRHQLEQLVDYLEVRYRALGIATRRQRFLYRGIAQSNLIAMLPAQAATGNGPAQPAIALADHIDTAFCEDVFARREQRSSAPGADDNAAATAALLRAGDVLRSIPQALRRHDIWLVHLTGEEFPADDLGARHFISDVLVRRVDVGALLVLDMIGHNLKQQPEFQLNPGGYFESGAISMRIAQVAALISPRVAKTLRPLVHAPTDLRSYLYNTDGLIFAESGFPVVHVAEVMNRYLLNRRGYHDTTDTVQNLDVPYAANITRVAISTAAVLSQVGIPIK